MNRSEPSERERVLRTLDANLNRATEALRVLEDVARFCVSDASINAALKQKRHALEQRFASLMPVMLSARDTQHDVGTEISTESELTRRGIADIATANFSRLGQALRCLEEFGKVIEPNLGQYVEQIRYDIYTLEQSFAAAIPKLADIRGAHLYVLVDGDENHERFRERVEQLVAAQVDAIQLRDKTLSDRELLDRAGQLVELTRGSNTVAIINDRMDIAMASAADGVHLGQDEMPIGVARRIVGQDLAIGISTHSIQQARQAEQDGADYIGVGPMFATTTKTFTDFPGIPLLKEVQAEIEIPAFAIGGITLEKLHQVTAVGCQRIAVQSALDNMAEISANVGEFRAQLANLAHQSDGLYELS